MILVAILLNLCSVNILLIELSIIIKYLNQSLLNDCLLLTLVLWWCLLLIILIYYLMSIY